MDNASICVCGLTGDLVTGAEDVIEPCKPVRRIYGIRLQGYNIPRVGGIIRTTVKWRKMSIGGWRAWSGSAQRRAGEENGRKESVKHVLYRCSDSVSQKKSQKST